ncbi:hypothetical protein [Streptomyces xiamenensis]
MTHSDTRHRTVEELRACALCSPLRHPSHHKIRREVQQRLPKQTRAERT